MIGLLITGGIVFILLCIFIFPGFFIIGARDVGILTRKNFGTHLPEGHIIASNGEIGIQADVLLPGFYWRFPILWSVKKVSVIVVNPDKIGIVKSIDGKTLPPHRLLGDEVDCDSFQNAKKFLSTGYRGAQIGFLRPGTYRINTSAFEVQVIDATKVNENQIGLIIAKDGLSLPSGYVVAPRPVDSNNNPISDPSIFQNGQLFINYNGYRGSQLDTLQPGTYYINTLLFSVLIKPLAEVPPGYVAVIRSNVGLELDKNFDAPKPSDGVLTTSPIHEETEVLLITDKNKRGIWRDPVAPGKYNLNTLAFSPYLVPTSAVTIDWASEGRIGTDVIGDTTPENAVMYKFNPLKVTSTDGFLLEVNVRMVIRIQPANAAFIIARFGSVANLIDQIVHPLIDSSFRNKAGSKKAIDFFQSRTELQADALEHAKSVFSEYNVEAQNLLIAYIDIPQSLLDTQTKKEIAIQQQEQYTQEASAQKERINVMEQTARAEKQAEVVAAQLSVGIEQNNAEAKKQKAEGDAVYAQRLAAAEGIGKAEGYKAQKEALGEQSTALVNVMTVLAEKGIKIVPDIQVSSNGGSGSLLEALIGKVIQKQ